MLFNSNVLSRLLPCLLILAIGGCEKKEERSVAATEELDEAAGERPASEPFIYARLQKTTSQVPARFKAALPASMADFKRDWSHFPPRSLIEASLCAGDSDMQGRFLSAVREAASGGSLDPKLIAAFSGLLGYCTTEAKCDWLAGSIKTEKAEPVRRVLFAGMARCTSAKYSEVLERADAPSEAIIDWYFSFYSKPAGKWNPQLERAAIGVAAKGNRYDVRKVGVVLGRFSGPKPVALIKRLQKKLKDPEHRALVAIGQGESKNPKARTLYNQACKLTEVAKDPLCRQTSSPAEPSATGEKPTLADRVRAYDTDVRALAAESPGKRTKVLTALAACLTGPKTKEYTRRTCLERLAVLDRARAVAEVSKVDPAKWRSDWSRALVATLIDYPEPGALERELSDLGLLPKKSGKPEAGSTARPSLLTRAILEESGRAMSFDTETGQFPNEHDGLLRELAGLASPALDKAVFEEVPPSGDRGPYRLRAYTDGDRYEVIAQNLGDWYDMEAVLGLLNTLLRERNSQFRYVSLPTGDQTATILAGPSQSLLAAAKKGLIRMAGAHDAMDTGKAFEQKVIEKLKRKGKVFERDVRIPSGGSTDLIVEE